MKKTTAGDDAAPSISKTERVIGLMKQPGGTTLEELIGATGWQPHSARAVIAGLRKKGHAIVREKVDGVSRYRISPADGR